MENGRSIENLLVEVKSAIKCHDAYANNNGEFFNIFTITGIGRDEVATHSRFIYELLNPKGTHGEGHKFLKLFAESFLVLEDYDTARNPAREDSTENSQRNRRIDFTLETDSTVVGIELKIDALDQPHQLHDYYQELKFRAKKINKKSILLVYLTIDGHEPDENSIVSKSKLSHEMQLDSYYSCKSLNDLLDWINLCAKESVEKPILREAIIQYKYLLEKITGNTEGIKMKVSELIKRDIDTMEAAKQISGSFINVKIDILAEFMLKLYDQLEETFGKEISIFRGGQAYTGKNKLKELCKSYYTKTKNNKDFGISIDLECPGGYKIEAKVRLYSWIQYGITMKGISPKSRDALREIIEQNKLEGRIAVDDKYSERWLCLFYRRENTKDGIDFAKINHEVMQLSFEGKFDDLTGEVVNHIKEIKNALCRFYDNNPQTSNDTDSLEDSRTDSP